MSPLWACGSSLHVLRGPPDPALQIKNRPLKFGVAIMTVLVSGLGIPPLACYYSHSKK